MVRSLLKVPAVRRVMLRLANTEAMLLQQESRLGALGDAIQRLRADEASHRARLAEVAEHMPPAERVRLVDDLERQRCELGQTRTLLQRLAADGADHRRAVGEIAQHMPPVRRARLEAAIAEAAARVGTLTAALEKQQPELADYKAALVRQQAQIDELIASMARQHGEADDLRAAMANQQAQLDGLTTAHRGEIEELRSTLVRQQSQLDALSEALSQQRGAADQQGAAYAAAANEQNIRVAALVSRIEVLSGEVGQLRSEADAHRARLAEVAEHLPPSQRANLEATLHGQQLQLGALNQTAHAQQLQLGALNDVIRGLAADGEQRVATVKAAPTPLEPAKIVRPPVPPHSFFDLLERKADLHETSTVFHLHVPKSGGGTVHALLRQNNFTPLNFDMDTKSFFRTFSEESWTENLLQPAPRRRFFMTGHYRLDAHHLRTAWMPHAVVTMLRDPFKRVLSHYNFTLAVPGNPFHDELLKGKMTFLEYIEWLAMPNSVGPQYSFFDDSGEGTFARTGSASVKHCFNNLLNKVSIFGLTERFDEFSVLFGYLLNQSNFVQRPVNETANLKKKDVEIKTTLTPVEKKGFARLYGDDVWFYKEAEKEYQRRVTDRRIQAVMVQTLPLLRQARDSIEQIMKIRDPADDKSGAFRIK